MLRRLARALPAGPRDALRPFARRLRLALPQGAWADAAVDPWEPESPRERAAGAWCVICRWTGAEFPDGFHSELATCPQCGSVARDRFLFTCLARRVPRPDRRLRVLETSPRLRGDYRRAMSRWFDHVTADFDRGSHAGDVVMDLADLGVRDASLDVVLSAHVLEHTPDPERCVREVRRALRPDGVLVLQVPMLSGDTTVPAEPEYHGDHTLVHWRFGLDLGDLLRRSGMRATMLTTADWLALLPAGPDAYAETVTGDIDLPGLVGSPHASDATAVVDSATARRYGFLPPWQFVTWECRPV